MSKLEYDNTTDPVSIVVADAGDDYGIKEKLDGKISVIKNTPMVYVSEGNYELQFRDLGYDLTYLYSIMIEDPASTYAYVTGELIGDTLVGVGSYVSWAQADEYFGDMLFPDAWDAHSRVNQERALISSSKAIRRLALMDFDTTPQDIKDAACENAYALLDGMNPEMEFENLSMTKQEYANIRSTYNRNISMEHIEAGLVSVAAWRLIKPYFDVSAQIHISRAS